VAAKFPGDVDACDNFFDFSKLFPHTVHRSKTYAGGPAPNEIIVILNHTLTDSVVIEVQNPDDNADFRLYLAHTANEEPLGRGITMKVGGHLHPKPSDLGDLNDTFLLLKNLSDVNQGAYVIKVRGLED
ncbi:MAG TPA: hypothetical protein VI757_14235, partial [Bacteroidia bacterium]|nr:hypothetical protein [Bacteroidia bacterium]